MPKAAKSPSKAVTNSRSPRAAKKNLVSNSFVDDEADESDGAVLVNKADDPLPGGDSQYMDDEYEQDFINDGDPFEGASVRTPPPSTQKAVAVRTPLTPSKTPAGKGEDDPVIDISSSDEDLEAMDQDDSMFKKPSGLKSTALPPSLTTRSAAAKRVSPSDLETPSRPSVRRKLKTAIVDDDDDELIVGEYVATFLKDNLASILAQAQGGVSGTKTSSQPGPVSSVKGKVRATASSADKKRAQFSPDWDPPFDGGLPSAPSTPSPSKAKPSASTSKGKAKAKAAPPEKKAILPPAEPVDDPDEVDAEVSKFMQSPQRGASAKAPLTMAEYFGVPDEDDTPARTLGQPGVDGTKSTVFLEDIEIYKAYFDPDAPCGVFDVELQDPALKPTYVGLPPLPDMLVDNSHGALLFKEASPNFINPSRVSPIRLSSRPSAGSTTTQRLHVDDRIATCVSALFCSESKLVVPAKIGAKSERMRKWISGIFHNQEWERFEALVCLVFGEQVLRAQLTPKHALSFQTMISPDNVSSHQESTDLFNSSAPADMFSPIKSKQPTKTTSSPSKFTSARTKTLLAFNDRVPVYDARKTVIDFESDLTKLNEVLPPFVGEVPFGSFIVVGYTCSVYNAALSGSNAKVPHLGCNVLWVITYIPLPKDFPDDVLVLIFYSVLGDFSANPEQYSKMLRKLRQINRAWRVLVDLHPLFWTKMYFTYSTYIPRARSALKRSMNLPLSVALEFVDNSFPRNNGWSAQNVENFIDVVFTVMDDSWDRCEDLLIRVSSGDAAVAIYPHIQTLRSLTARRVAITFGYVLPPGARPLSHLFDDRGGTRSFNMPRLSSLSLDGFLPKWSTQSAFSGLSSLSLRPCSYSTLQTVEWNRLHSILGSTTRLTHLELLYIECMDFPLQLQHTPSPTLPRLPYVESLTFGVAGVWSVRLARALVLPALRKMVLHIPTSDAFHDVAMGVPRCFAQAESLELITPAVPSTTDLAAILSPMVNLLHLDATAGGMPFFARICGLASAAYRGPAAQMPVAVCLDKLTVGCGCTMAMVKPILTDRRPLVFGDSLKILANHAGCCGLSPTKWYVKQGRVHMRLGKKQ
ncbi:hypothetical protein C8R46DRAFT_1216644 [Mycena filopes]|nr:hypothetical protein C8R46DRAFT_1216644 [Mycena filopes]